MKKDNKKILPSDFFDTPRKIISSEEALKDVTPVNWQEALKTRKSNKGQIVKLVNKKND